MGRFSIKTSLSQNLATCHAGPLLTALERRGRFATKVPKLWQPPAAYLGRAYLYVAITGQGKLVPGG